MARGRERKRERESDRERERATERHRPVALRLSYLQSHVSVVELEGGEL